MDFVVDYERLMIDQALYKRKEEVVLFKDPGPSIYDLEEDYVIFDFLFKTLLSEWNKLETIYSIATRR